MLIYTMATGINYNNVWAALGYPVDVIAGKVETCLSGTFGCNEIGHAHQPVHENKNHYGNMACLVNVTEQG